MLFLILAVVIFVALFGVLGITQDATWKLQKRQWFSVFAFLIVVFGCIKTVPTGHTGVVTVFGTVESQTYDA